MFRKERANLRSTFWTPTICLALTLSFSVATFPIAVSPCHAATSGDEDATPQATVDTKATEQTKSASQSPASEQTKPTQQSSTTEKTKSASNKYPGNDSKLAQQLFTKANQLVSQEEYDEAIPTYVESYLANWHNAKHGERCASQLVVLSSKLDREQRLRACRLALFCNHHDRKACLYHGNLARDPDNPVALEKTADELVAKGDRFGALVDYSASMEKANNAEVRKKFKNLLSEVGLPN